MKHLLSSYLYRLAKQPGTWVLLGLTVINSAFSCFSCGMLFGDAPWILEYKRSASEMMAGNGVDFEGMISSITSLLSTRFDVKSFTAFDFSSFSMLLSVGFFLNPPLLMVFFISVFIHRERTFGYIKNLIPYYTREKIETAHILIILLYSAAVTLISAALGIALSGGFFRSAVSTGSWPRFLLFYLTETALMTVIGMFIDTLTDLIRRPYLGSLLSVVYFSFGSSFLYGMLSSMASGIARRQISVQQYFPFGCLSSFLYEDKSSLLKGAVSAAVFGAVLVFLRYYMVKNKESKDMI